MRRPMYPHMHNVTRPRELRNYRANLQLLSIRTLYIARFIAHFFILYAVSKNNEFDNLGSAIRALLRRY